jgi:hypothetical protein
MKKLLILSVLVASTPVMAEEYITPADISETAQNKMHEISMDYNQCMMQSRLEVSANSGSVKDAANDILVKCETHLDEMKTLLTDNKVFEPLAIGLTKKMRSRAARQLMTQSMNSMAAQAAAVVNVEKAKAEKAQ